MYSAFTLYLLRIASETERDERQTERPLESYKRERERERKKQTFSFDYM